MDDLISRQAAIDVASGYCHPANIADELRKLPSVQPERKNGEWERKSFYDSTPICSECGIEGRWDFEYCPYCGADMRGGQDE